MRKTLLLTAMLIASVFTAHAQLVLSSAVETAPRTDWDYDYFYYDMGAVATALGYADASALGADLIAFVRSETTDLQVYNVSKNGNETMDNPGDEWYWHWEPTLGAEGEWMEVHRGCHWLDVYGEEVGWTTTAALSSCIDWDVAGNNLIIRTRQNAYYNNGSGLPVGEFLITTKLVRGTATVTIYNTLVVTQPEGLPFEPVTTLSDLTIVKEAKVEVTQPIMLDWAQTSDENPYWEVDGTELIEAILADYPDLDLSLINTNMGQVYWARAWDNVADDLSNTLSNLHAANANGFWMTAVVDGETGLKTEYCVPDNWTGSDDFFTENIRFDTETYAFSGDSGQNPGNKYKGGEHFYADFYFVLGDKAIHVEFHFNVEKDVDYPFDEMEKVGERTITWTQEPRTDTSGLKKWIPNYAEILDLLGCAENAIRFKLLQPDQTIASDTNTGNNGFWVDAAGYKATDVEKMAFYVDYTADLMALSVGQYPNVNVVGDELVATIMLCNKEKYYQINVILDIEDLTKAATEDYHEVASYTYTMRTLINGSWDCTEKYTEPLDMDVVEEALGSSDFVVYAKMGDTWSTGYTCTPYAGFWFTPEGEVVWWNNGAYIGMCYERNYIMCFKNPQQEVKVGDSFTHSMYLVNEVTGAYVTLTVQVTYVDEIVDYEDVGEETITVNVDPSIDDGWATEVLDGTTMFEALGITADDFWNGDVKVMAKNGDLYEAVNDPGLYEYFFDADGNVVAADGSEFSFQVAFEVGENNDVNVVACATDFVAEETTGQEHSTTFCIQKGSKRYFLTVRLFYGLEDSIEGITVNGQNRSNIYTLAGQRVSAPVRGLYIIDGRKTLVKYVC